MAISSKI